jgi:hypothetical protein
VVVRTDDGGHLIVAGHGRRRAEGGEIFGSGELVGGPTRKVLESASEAEIEDYLGS